MLFCLHSTSFRCFSGSQCNPSPLIFESSPSWPPKALAVVVPVGTNCGCSKESFWERAEAFVGMRPDKDRYGKIVVLDADDGKHLWTFDLPYWNDACAGNTWEDTNCPDMMGNPAIDGKGTVYVNWSGGHHYALRDANKDGRIDPKDPNELSSYYSGHASNGCTAIAPGLSVFPNCRTLVAYTS
eukprot:gnl/TRDRNA2_/TRDRNA2_167734_c0_seq1.p1 gnl/TRDRNA2_/TRDRNA2_167734_c0~~gnl/TRDRNA2_/TRDRNA2_167734_c0_seq1.p1  ORF type:complete len:184 (+),score=16.11 gnl/TRDRNA2_/TRDRNA2_167734_c0_seq1:20-571(+)